MHYSEQIETVKFSPWGGACETDMNKIRSYGNICSCGNREKIHKIFLKCFGSLLFFVVIAKIILQQIEESFSGQMEGPVHKYVWEKCQLTNLANKKVCICKSKIKTTHFLKLLRWVYLMRQ